MTTLNMSARAFDRILRVARTIANLASAQNLPARLADDEAPSEAFSTALSVAVSSPVEARHIAEAIGCRALDRPQNFGVVF